MRDLLGRIAKMPVSIAVILVWIAIWILVSCNKNALPQLEGKGISQIGNQNYRFFTAGLTHTNAIHLLANVCAMFWIGFLYEHRIGSIRFLIIAVICAVLSQVLFLSIYRNAAEALADLSTPMLCADLD
jgi:membrane associated rhomboid family serine protease